MNIFLFVWLGPLRVFHSFPTGRSSDLSGSSPESRHTGSNSGTTRGATPSTSSAMAAMCSGVVPQHPPNTRSEEHTSELQSRFDLVCRLLLEKKKPKGQERQKGQELYGA